jgi:uncharacterized protein (UPF0147 family)
MTTLDLEPRDEIDGHLTDINRLLKAAIIVIDDLDADDENVPQNIINAAIEKLEKIEEMLTKQPPRWPAA